MNPFSLLIFPIIFLFHCLSSLYPTIFPFHSTASPSLPRFSEYSTFSSFHIIPISSFPLSFKIYLPYHCLHIEVSQLFLAHFQSLLLLKYCDNTTVFTFCCIETLFCCDMFFDPEFHIIFQLSLFYTFSF